MSWKHGLGSMSGTVVHALSWLQERWAPVRERLLSERERRMLEVIFRSSVDLEQVRLKEAVASPLAASGRAFVIGNIVFLPTRSLPLSDHLLVHELVHVWQSQNGGAAYILDSVYSQWFGEGYDFMLGVRQGRSWHQLNCEQQAALVEAASRHRFFTTGRLVIDQADLSPYMRRAWHELQAGRGATR